MLRRGPGGRAWTWWTSWPASRWWSPRRPGARPGTGCWRPSASTLPTAWPRRAKPGRPGGGTPRRSSRWRNGNATSRCLAREQDNFRAALGWALSEDSETGPRLARALGGFWLARGFFQEGHDWLERALATGPADPRLRADLLRLLGMILVHADPERAEVTLSEGCQIAAAAGLHAVQARIRVLLSEIRAMLGGTGPEALRECEAAAAVLESEGDLEGLAEAWAVIGFGTASSATGQRPSSGLERAAAYAPAKRQPPRRAEAVGWLVATPGCPSPPMWRSAGRSDSSKRPPATRGPRQASSPRSRCFTATLAASPTPARRSGAPSPRTPDPGRKSTRPCVPP